MDKTLAVYLLGLSTLGGLIMLPALPGYLPLTVISLLTGWVVYAALRIQRSKHIFLLLMLVNFVTGLVLRLTPHEASGALGSLGLMVAVIVFVPSLILLMKIRKAETLSD